MPIQPYPSFYRFVFGVLEPAGLIAGAAFALLFPGGFHEAYLGKGWLGDAMAKHHHAGPKSVLVAAGMGSCMLIIGLISAVLLPTLQRTLTKHRDLHESILRAYLGCLLVGDFVHIAAVLVYLPSSVRFHPLSRWTILIWGNLLGTLLPNLARLAWFTQIGRRARSIQI